MSFQIRQSSDMNEEVAYKNYVDWATMQRRGRQRIQKASKDPVARAKFLAEKAPPGPVIRRPQLHESRADASSLPAYCISAATSSRPAPAKNIGYSFLGSFPAETRNAIYQYAVHYPTCRELFDAYYGQVDKFMADSISDVSRNFSIRLHTPTILLLCKQITREALTVLRLLPFVIDRIPPWIMGNARPLPLTYFISKPTLQNVRFVEIKLSLGDCERYSSGRIWFHALEKVLRAWSEANSLLCLKVMIKVNNIDVDRLWNYELRIYAEIIKMIDCFAFKHGSRPDLLQYEHWVLDCEYAYRCGFRNPLIRKHPDPHIWQGSVMEWL